MPGREPQVGEASRRMRIESMAVASSRRSVLALMLGACRWLPGTLPAAPTGATPPASSGAPDGTAPGSANKPAVRLAISESLVSGVNLNDARAAMLIWLR